MTGAVVLGARTPAFAGKPRSSLELLDTRTWKGSSNVLVRYRLRRSVN